MVTAHHLDQEKGLASLRNLEKEEMIATVHSLEKGGGQFSTRRRRWWSGHRPSSLEGEGDVTTFRWRWAGNFPPS